MTTPFEFLQTGKLLDAVISVYTVNFAPLEFMFYSIVIFTGLSLVYIKTENFGTVGILGTLIAGATLAYIPAQFHQPAYVLLFLSLAIIVWKLFVGDKSG